MNKYGEFTERKLKEYGSKFDPSELNVSFIDAFNSGERVTVSFIHDGKEYDRKRGTIGVTTGWKPCFLLMLTKRSRGSSWTIGKNDKIINWGAL